METQQKFSDQLEAWLRSDEPKTLGALVALFEEKSFAVVFVVLMALPALPLPTGGATHVLELIVMLFALQLVVGRRRVWLPDRLARRDLGGVSQQKFVNALIRRIRSVERFSKPRLVAIVNHRLSNVLYGLVVIALTLTAFVAPPFTGLDTLPALGVVLISLGVLLEDIVLVVAGMAVGAFGVFLVVGLGKVIVDALGGLF